MLTTARLKQDLSPAGLAWVSALRTDGIRKLLRPGKSGGDGEAPAPLRPGELVPDRVAEILSPDFPRRAPAGLPQSPLAVSRQIT